MVIGGNLSLLTYIMYHGRRHLSSKKERNFDFSQYSLFLALNPSFLHIQCNTMRGFVKQLSQLFSMNAFLRLFELCLLVYPVVGHSSSWIVRVSDDFGVGAPCIPLVIWTDKRCK